MTRSARAVPWVALTLVVSLAGGVLPAPLYPLYQEQWGYSNAVITTVFAAYAVGVIISLMLLGSVSDGLGRRPLLVAGTALCAASAAAFLGTGSLPMLLVARGLSGLSVGVLTSTATASLVDLLPGEGGRRGSLLASFSVSAGLVVGSLAGGLMGDLAPSPLWSAYLTLLGAALVAMVGSASTVETHCRSGSPRRFALRLPRVPAGSGRRFASAAPSALAAFLTMGYFSGLLPSFLWEALDLDVLWPAGVALAGLYAAGACAQLIAGRAPVASLRWGSLATCVGVLLATIGLATSSLGLVLAAALPAGAGSGLLFVSSLAGVMKTAPADGRADLAAAYYCVAYAGLVVPVMGVGYLSTHVGITWSAIACAAVVVALAVGAVPAATGGWNHRVP